MFCEQTTSMDSHKNIDVLEVTVICSNKYRILNVNKCKCRGL